MSVKKDIKQLVDNAFEVNPAGFLELIKREVLPNVYDEQSFVEAFYEDPSTFDPEKGLEVDQLDQDPEMLKDLILQEIEDRQKLEQDGINTSYEEMKELLNSGHISEEEVEGMRECLDNTLQSLERQEITLRSARDFEELLGAQLALAEREALASVNCKAAN